MKFRIHYTVNGSQDSFDVSGETIEDVSKKALGGLASRGLDTDKVEPWSEELK